MEEKQLKAQRAIEYYMLYNKLKETIRTGWLSWNVKRSRIESIAEHCFGA